MRTDERLRYSVSLMGGSSLALVRHGVTVGGNDRGRANYVNDKDIFSHSACILRRKPSNKISRVVLTLDTQTDSSHWSVFRGKHGGTKPPQQQRQGRVHGSF